MGGIEIKWEGLKLDGWGQDLIGLTEIDVTSSSF